MQQAAWDELTRTPPGAARADRAAARERRQRRRTPRSTSSTAAPRPRSTRRSPPELLRELNEELLRVPERFTVHPKLVRQLERRRDALDGRDRLGARRGARVRVAARRGHADPPDRAGHRARHLQPAPSRAPRRRQRPDLLPDPAAAELARRRSSSTTARSRRSAASASSTATARSRRRRSCSGRRSSATSSTRPR